jgi:hypothetical protein
MGPGLSLITHLVLLPTFHFNGLLTESLGCVYNHHQPTENDQERHASGYLLSSGPG